MADEFSRKAVARRLRLVRIAAFGAQRQNAFAELLGLIPTRYNNYEKNRARVPPELIVKISTMFGYDHNYIYRGDQSNLSLDKIEALKKAEMLLQAIEEDKQGRQRGKTSSR